MNALQMILKLAQSGGNPAALLQQMAMNNPVAAQVIQMTQGKSEAEIKAIALNMCRERGISPEEVFRSAGIK